MKKLITFATLLLTASMGQVALATNQKIGSAITVSGTTYYTASTNLITNGSFESGFTGWTNSSDYSTTITSEKFSLETDDAKDGNNYLVGTTNSGSSSDGSLGTAWSIEKDKTYYFCYWIKNLDGTTETEYLMTSLTNTKGTETKGLDCPASVSSDWQRVEYMFTNDDGYKYLQVKFRWLENHWGFDDFQLYEIQDTEITLPDDDEYKVGDTETVNGITWTVKGANLFTNGGFNDGVDGWTAGGYGTAANIDNFTVYGYGGYNDGAYLVTNSGGASNEKTPSQAINVEVGKTYLFVGYTNGTEPEHRYSALFEMDDEGKAETNHIEGSDSYSNEIIRLNWGDGTEWCRTMDVFSPATNYVGMRMGWSDGSYDGFQIYEVEAVALADEPTSENPMDMTDFITNPDASQVSNIGWTGSGYITRSSGQHWSGTSQSYFEPNHWSASGIFEESIYQNITLPYDGVYRLTAAGRSSDDARTILVAGDMEYTFPAIGAEGGTIATDGTTCEVGTEGKEFANNGAGYGWNWGSVEVVAEAGTLQIGARFDETSSSAEKKWASIVDFKLEYLGSGIDALKEALATDIADAKAIDVTTNIGTEAFKLSKTFADELTAAIEEAEEALEDGSATVESLTAALTALQTAVHNFDNAGLNAPADGETFSIILGNATDNGADKYQGKAVYFNPNGATSQGNYRFYWDADQEWNRNYAYQQFTFTPDDSKAHGYVISFVDEDKTMRYLTLGSKVSGGSDNSAIRATGTEEDAFVFQIMLTDEEDVWYLYNSTANNYVGTNGDNGFYCTTRATNYDLHLVSNEIPVNITAAGWTTLVLPYDAELPSTDLTAYTIAGQSETQENAVTLEEAGTELKAKTPYLINGTEVKEYAINGTSTVFDLTEDASDKYLVGTWEYIPSVTQGNYVLQNQPEVDGTAFYIVNGTQGDITLAMNRCYLLGSSVSTANAPYFSLSMNEDTATAIEAVAEETAETGDGAIYDLGGRRVSKAQKGIYIKDGKKVIIK